MNPKRVILVRHGQSTFNAQKRFQGCCDESVLTEKGHLNAYQTGIALQDTIDAIYTSPLQRTRETAQEILAALKLDSSRIHLNANLKEIDLPAWQGLPFQRVREQFADDYRTWKEHPHEFEMPSPVENQLLAAPKSVATTNTTTSTLKFNPIQLLYQQARRFWQNLPCHEGETILLVSHGGTIRALISTALGINCDRYHLLQQSNCGISVLNFDSTYPQLEALNLTQHLGEILPKLKDGKLGLRLLLLPVEQFNKASTQQLASYLKSIPLDFYFNSDTESVRATAEVILQEYPSILHLQVSLQNLFTGWYSIIPFLSLNVLTTGLVIAECSAITSALHQIFGLPTDSTAFLLKPGTLSVLHYPQSVNHPVLQAMNIDINTAL